ncbi:MAG: ATP-binding protein, partial [Spirochaetia bacterium]|nr:ATP-binding protein [Spirochaetia bacterium]
IQLIQKAIKKKRETDGMLPDEKFLEKYLDVVNEEISELNSTVMDFLFAVRPIQANFILDDPDDIIEKTTDFLEYDFSQSNISFKLDLEKKNQKLLIDPKLLRDVLINLLQNAKAAILSCEDGRNGVLVLKTFEKDNHFVITVADNGCGMTNDQCSKIFEPYYTTKADGTGLGLTTVYKIIKEFKGDINVQSELNKGTIFTISIPVPQKETKLLEEKAN